MFTLLPTFSSGRFITSSLNKLYLFVFFSLCLFVSPFFPWFFLCCISTVSLCSSSPFCDSCSYLLRQWNTLKIIIRIYLYYLTIVNKIQKYISPNLWYVQSHFSDLCRKLLIRLICLDLTKFKTKDIINNKVRTM